MLRKVTFWLVILGMVVLPACTTNNGKPGPDECLYGLWQLKGGEAFARATIPAGALEQDALTFSGGGGAVFYNFKPDGTLIVAAGPMMVRFSAKVERTVAELDINMDGSASAKYTLTDNLIQVTDFDEGEMVYVATLDGEEMMNSVLATDFVPLFVDPYNSAKIQCIGDSLFLTISDLPGNIPAIEFVRRQPTPTP